MSVYMRCSHTSKKIKIRSSTQFRVGFYRECRKDCWHTEGSNILLIVERYAHGIRIASCWNTQERRYGLQEHDDYLFVRKDGSVTHKLSGDVFVFRKKKRA